MFGARTFSRIATTLLMLASIAVTGMSLPTACAASKTDGVASCCEPSRPCGCEAKVSLNRCCCQRDQHTPASLPSSGSDGERVVKVVQCLDAASVDAPFVGSAPQAYADTCRYLSPFARSVQTLLCIWRI
ncbi:MAG: hypothetical protein ACO1RT_21230 [Planctomycetaceae bacterium]